MAIKVNRVCCYTNDDGDVELCPLHRAAPDLLAALEAAERQLRQWHISTKPASRVDVRVQEAIDTARAAIRKAKGD